jgi:N-acetylglucosaminyldiphosphoundecaprenol N-acetyl-beta-D-mannosaminyltransferase
MGLSSAPKDVWSENSPANEQQDKERDFVLSSNLPSLSRCRIGSLPVDRVNFDEATQWALNYLHRRGKVPPSLIVGPNAQLVTLAEKDPQFARAMCSAGLAVADGISVVMASRWLGTPVPERVPGGELMERLCSESAKHGFSVFLLGGLSGAAETAAQRLVEKYPGLTIAGTHCPPYGFERDPAERSRVREVIAASEPDILFVAFGAPKQEIWMWENCPTLPVRIAMSVGAAFDTQAGLRKRAPEWAQKSGTEWLYRLIREPRRLWRRYLIGNTEFLMLIMKQLLFTSRQRA